MEPKIGHLKSDHRLDRNYLKGAVGDRVNAVLAGAGANIRKLLNAFWRAPWFWWRFWRKAVFLEPVQCLFSKPPYEFHVHFSGTTSYRSDDNHIVNCTFLNNEATDNGGAIRTSDKLDLINCLFNGNSAELGGALHQNYDESEEVYISHCTFTNNHADEGGAVFRHDSGTGPFEMEIWSSILWSNTAGAGTDADQIGGSTNNLTLWFNCIEGYVSGGTQNHGDDPLFVDADGIDNVAGTADDNLRLTSGSPCVNEAANTPPYDVADLDNDGSTSDRLPLDLDGGDRDVGSAPDQGCYERPSTLPTCETPGAPILDSPVVVDAISATLSWLPGSPAGSSPVHYYWALGATSSVTYETGYILRGITTGQGVLLEHLSRHTTYHFVVKAATNCDGTASAYASPVSFTTDYGKVLFVDQSASGANDGSSWANAFNYLQDALQAAIPGTDILVAAGTYRPDQGGGYTLGDTDAYFDLITTDVAIYGGLAGTEDPATLDLEARDFVTNETIISADVNGDDGTDFTQLQR